MRARGTLRSDDGFALMEVIVSAAVLILVVLGVLAAMDTVTKTSGFNKARTVAATLAEKDQERLRGMRTLDVDQMNLEPYSVPVAGVTYEIESEAVWVTDASDDEVTCAVSGIQNNGQGSYMRITSTVTSPATGAALKPVVLSSIVAPQVGAATRGSLAVKVKNAAGQGVGGVTVNAPPAASEVTNSEGCAIFGQLDAANYTVTLNTAGWVDRNGNNPATLVAGVTAGNLTTVEMSYDRAASITVNVQNRPTANGGVAEPARTVLAANSGLGAGLRTWSVLPTDTLVNASYPVDGSVRTNSTYLASSLFPFPEGYTFYSGNCLRHDPSRLVSNYFSNYSGAVVLAPGQSGGSVTVYEPDANFTVRTGSGAVRTNATVFAYPTGATCTGGRIPMGTSSLAGKTPYMGLPYGDFNVCAQYTSSGTLYRNTVAITVNTPTGASAAVNIPLSTSSTQGACPSA